MWVSQNCATASDSMPTITIGRGPILGSSTMLDTFAETAMQATIGRNASPLTTGEYPRDTCM